MSIQGYLGIDVAKDSFTVCFLLVDEAQDHILSQETATFSMDQPGWLAFRTQWQALPTSSWTVGLEASGPYSRLLEAHLAPLPYPTFRLSPLQVRRFAQSRSLRKTKTDSIDARTLAHFLRQQHHQPPPVPPLQPHLTARPLARLEEDLTAQLTRTQNQFRQLLHTLFPELERRFRRFPKAIRRILHHYPSAHAIAQANPQHLRTLLAQGPGKLPALTVEDLQSLARTSFGFPDPTLTLALQHLLSLWDLLEQHRRQVRQQLQTWAQQHHPQAFALLTAIPGIGPLMAARFLALIGSLARFPNRKALIAYAGLDPTLYQSGRFHGRSRLSKRGHPALRHLLFLMAQALVRHTRRFQSAFHSYRQQGRPYRETLVILARKALSMLYTLLIRMIPFQDLPPQTVSH